MPSKMRIWTLIFLLIQFHIINAGLFGPDINSPFIGSRFHRLSLSELDEELSVLESELSPSQCSLPMNARNVSMRCVRYMTRVERMELEDVDKVWYFSPIDYRIRSEAAEKDMESKEGFPELFENDQLDFRYKIGQKISAGAEGSVIRAYDMSRDGELVAVKFIRKERDHRYEDHLLDILADKMSAYRHDSHVIEPLQHIIYRGWDAWVFPYFSSDWFKMSVKMPIIPLSKLQKLTFDMLQALNFIKSCRIVHLDIKPENIMYDEETEASYLADFGLSLHENEMFEWPGIRGTFEFMPPELQLNSTRVSYEADMWSLGVTVFTLLTNTDLLHLDNMKNQEKLQNTIKRLRIRVPPETHSIDGHIEIPSGRERSIEEIRSLWFISRLEQVLVDKYSDEETEIFMYASDFINRCLQWEPTNRITVEQALKHPFVRHLHNQNYTGHRRSSSI